MEGAAPPNVKADAAGGAEAVAAAAVPGPKVVV